MATVHHLADTPERLELAASLDPGDVRTLNLLAGQGLLLYQGEAISEYSGPAEIPVDSLLARINRLGQAVFQRPVVWRQTPFDLQFEFQLYTFDYLPVTVTLGLTLAIASPRDLVQQFLADSATLDSATLRRHLYAPLQGTLGKDLRGRNLSAMVQDGQLRPRLLNLLRSDLEKRLGQAGLKLEDVHLVELFHPGHDAARRQQAEIHLALEQEQDRQTAQAALDALYDEAEWARIRRRESAIQQKIRQRELDLDEQERDILHRERELHTLARVAAAETQEAALKLLSEDELAKVRHQLLGGQMEREGEVADWQHLQALAARKRDQELQSLDNAHRRSEAAKDAESQARISGIERQQKREDLETTREHLTGLQQIDAAMDGQTSILALEKHLVRWMLQLTNAVRGHFRGGAEGEAADRRLRALYQEMASVKNPPEELLDILRMLDKLLDS